MCRPTCEHRPTHRCRFRQVVTGSTAHKNPFARMLGAFENLFHNLALPQFAQYVLPHFALRHYFIPGVGHLFLSFFRNRAFSNSFYTSLTVTPASRSTFKSLLGTFLSVITSWIFEVARISDKLRRPNLLESHTSTTRRAAPAMARFTRASRRLGVVKPYRTSKPSTPRNKRSALNFCNDSSASGPTSENEFALRTPPVRITCTAVSASSPAMF